MTKPDKLTSANLWSTLTAEAEQAIKKDPLVAGLMQGRILGHLNFADALGYTLASKVAENAIDIGLGRDTLYALIRKCYADDSEIVAASKKDILAVMERDPAVANIRMAFLYFKGYQALQLHRIAHHLWRSKRHDMAHYLNSQSSIQFGVDIHPAAQLGRGIMMDHATGIVIGETAVIEDDVSLLHGVTLGGTGKHDGDRHPKIRKGALIGADATILGNIEIGAGTRVAAGSVVLASVPAHVTVAGIPARIVGKAGCAKPGTLMDQIPIFQEKECGKLHQKGDFAI